MTAPEDLARTLAERIATDLERSGFFGWLLSNGDSALWEDRTPEQEIGRVAAKYATDHLASVVSCRDADLQANALEDAAARARERDDFAADGVDIFLLKLADDIRKKHGLHPYQARALDADTHEVAP